LLLFNITLSALARFNFDTADKDVALLKLDGRVNFHHRQMWWVRPVCLHHHQSGEEELVGKPGVILGWGAPNLTLPTDNKLQETAVRVVSNKECARNYSKEDIPITRNMLCATLEGAHVSLLFLGGIQLACYLIVVLFIAALQGGLRG